MNSNRSNSVMKLVVIFLTVIWMYVMLHSLNNRFMFLVLLLNRSALKVNMYQAELDVIL